ncbi:uncharacterized protein V1510DRAFT_423161 [Dipodascopsis tothii]|uniref:uncharacterized protein n=1 Tax=Dipodascopsis tothii TaxID=44089 RepID=UPI0034CDC4A8
MPAPIRIANVSGATGDAPHAMRRMVDAAQIDAVTGDWLSEMNIAWNSIAMKSDPTAGYDPGFLRQLAESLDAVAARKIKVVTNAGALNPRQLVAEIRKLCAARGLDLKVALVEGDNVSSLIGTAEPFGHLDTAEPVAAWGRTPEVAIAYLGCRAIVAALTAGADIVICGRVTDASPVIGLAAWWHGWDLDTDLDMLAAGLLAGHLIECGPYVTGANFSGFKPFLDTLVDVGFPIAEIAGDGGIVVTKQPNSNGYVRAANVRAQFLYELQGELYYNPDVVADVTGVRIEQLGPDSDDRVAVSGARGLPPPDTTKVLLSAVGGYQAEAYFFINGLDVAEKAQMMRNQLAAAFADSRFSKLAISLIGAPEPNARTQSAGTCMLRVFAQAEKKEDIDASAFKIPIYAIRMQSYPGYHMELDFRMMEPKMFMELWPATIPTSALNERAVLDDGTEIAVSHSPALQPYDRARVSYETPDPVPLESFGPTVDLPLGTIVHARSGDKANNSNVGFFVRHDDEYPWLRSFLTIDRVKALFADDIPDPAAVKVERCEFRNILAVHFRVMDFLDGGIASSSRIDGLGKGVGEYLRSRVVPLPEAFVARGRI